MLRSVLTCSSAFYNKMACIKDAVHSPDLFLRQYFLPKMACIKDTVHSPGLFLRHSPSRRRSKSPSPVPPSRQKSMDLGRSASFHTHSQDHRVFRASDLIHGKVLGSGFFGQAVLVSGWGGCSEWLGWWFCVCGQAVLVSGWGGCSKWVGWVFCVHGLAVLMSGWGGCSKWVG